MQNLSLSAHGGKERQRASKAAVNITQADLGELSPNALHLRLCALVDTSPDRLNKNLQKADLQAILKAYDPDCSTAGTKVTLVQQLVAAIAGHPDGFTVHNPSIMKVTPVVGSAATECPAAPIVTRDTTDTLYGADLFM